MTKFKLMAGFILNSKIIYLHTGLMRAVSDDPEAGHGKKKM